MFKKITAIALLTALMLPAGAAFARHHNGGWEEPPRHHRSHGYHRDHVTGALIIGGIIGAIITSAAKDREHDGVNDKKPHENCGRQ